jgi:hypothetical protein
MPFVAFLALAAAPPPERKLDLPAFLGECAAQEAALLAFFRDETKWKDPDHTPATLKYLQAARVLRPRSLAPVLARHIAYNPREAPTEKIRLPVDQRFPVYGVLRSIGVPAVPALLNQLKESDPEDRRSGQRTHNLLIYCLADLYDQGGSGAALARQRIGLEAEKANGQAKKWLLRALEHPALKPALPEDSGK